MNPAVRQAIEARIEALDEQITHSTEVLTSYQTARDEAEANVTLWSASVAHLTTERDELVAALPEPAEVEEPAPDLDQLIESGEA
ncbi:hypothetical protein CVS54_01376 [Microbacterium oxydans]|uniref:Uncharacterized protein n=1 Tax=Microbacterium oxydans TaxID=82380 RepID=A0A3S9WIY8_9MICO|nr:MULTISPECIES: hypothetical protein [Microbacterium]AZS40054.1 hypothetical protein CVS54_01376 [Microbacterium oxydans]